MKRFLLFSLVIFLNLQVQAQERFFQTAPKIQQEIVPLVLIGTGSILLLSNIDNQVQEGIVKYTTHLDDYTQWTPLAMMFIVDAFDMQAKKHAVTQFAYAGLSTISNAIVVHAAKRIFDRTRPSGGHHSFPSGHTSQAFISARVLWHEYKDSKPWLAHSGYLFATATGIMRMTNNKHWFTDVVVGAGVGMLMTDIIYLWDPLKNWEGFKFGNTTALPSIQSFQNNYTAGLTIKFQ